MLLQGIKFPAPEYLISGAINFTKVAFVQTEATSESENGLI